MIDIAIIGGGPAGLTAGLYAARSGRSCLLFEEIFVGGQAAKTFKIENYPGFAEGVEGSQLGMNMEQQAVKFGLEIRYDPVVKLELDGDVKRVITEKETTEARTVIIATGAEPRKLGLADEERLTGAGVSYCATCDGAFFRGRDVAVVGGGDTAVSDALYLSKFAKSVKVIHRRDTLRASETLQKAAFGDPKIEFLWNSVPKELIGEDRLTGILIENKQTGEQKKIDVDAVFIAVGIEPKSALVKDILELTPEGYIRTDCIMQTSEKGVYAAGDVRDTPLRQVVTAVADGAVAATKAVEYLTT
jgi:thioredoxin reductase (NADPH)